ncbi:MAG: single-stranded DNA-binding protein [Bacteroidales bacterium]|nr:single-stranded DNA-binding protein [Bacteroidales bacterium]
MAGINKVILVGNLGKDPEVRTLESGAKVANFTLATSETYKNKEGQRVTHTEWHNIVLWRGLAEVAEKYLKKGNQIYVEGKIKTRSWDDKDGIKRYTTEIFGDNMTMLGGRRDDTDAGTSQASEEDTAPEADVSDEKDDLPF